jgi:molybdate transport system ATP-binding protein
MRPLLDKYVILLSSGELRKFQLIKALLSNPRILILDNPFIGLDAEARRQLNELLLTIATEQQTELWLVLSKRGDIPDYADEVLEIDQTTKDAVVASGKEKGIKDTVLEEAWQQRSELMAELTTPTANNTLSASPVVIDMHNVSIRYGERTILKELDWRVMKGERWALGGQNGSGKSTLLSLVCADNPQSYACDIALFGQQRGTGESIWEIKKHIGYVSPEMHRSYLRDIKTVNVVASGLKDTVGLYMRPNDEEKELCRRWLSVFGIEQLADRSFITLSSGEQRLALVARAFVKNPDLLILDEPLHGLDDQNRRLVQHIINQFCEDKSKTLIMVTHYEEELPACIEKKLYLRRN